ncbi:hypothetical protein ACJX0J_033219, partial [Zea mays]
YSSFWFYYSSIFWKKGAFERSESLIEYTNFGQAFDGVILLQIFSGFFFSLQSSYITLIMFDTWHNIVNPNKPLFINPLLLGGGLIVVALGVSAMITRKIDGDKNLPTFLVYIILVLNLQVCEPEHYYANNGR